MGKRWTEAEDDSLRIMRTAGVSYRDIAKMLKRTEQACAQRGSIIGATKKGRESLPIDLPVADTSREASYPLDLDYNFLKPKPRVPWWKRLFGIGG